MFNIAKIQNYSQAANKVDTPVDWMSQLNNIIEARQNDESTIDQLLKLLVDITGSDNISIAIPDGGNRFQPRYCSRQIENGVYSFTVQHSLCKAFETNSVLLVREGTERADAFDRSELTAFDFKYKDHCILVPLRLRQTTLAVLVLDLRNIVTGCLPLQELWFICSQIAHMIATQVVPNFQTLYSRPYQKVNENDLGVILSTVDKCSGNKTMAAKMLGLTPRQLRYRIAKLS